MKKLILVALIVIAPIFAIGSACAWSDGNIGILQCLIQCAISVGIEWIALKNIDM